MCLSVAYPNILISGSGVSKLKSRIVLECVASFSDSSDWGGERALEQGYVLVFQIEGREDWGKVIIHQWPQGHSLLLVCGAFWFLKAGALDVQHSGEAITQVYMQCALVLSHVLSRRLELLHSYIWHASEYAQTFSTQGCDRLMTHYNTEIWSTLRMHFFSFCSSRMVLSEHGIGWVESCYIHIHARCL